MPNPGDIAVVQTAGVWYDRAFSYLIRWFTAKKVPTKRTWRTLWRSYTWQKSSVNHAFGMKDANTVIEAALKVRETDISAYPGAVWITLPATLTPNDTQRQQIVAFWESKVGTWYNVLDLFAIAIAQKRFGNHIAELSKSWWVKRLSNGKNFICSQLMDAGYESVGIHLFTDGRPTGLVSPEDLDELDVNVQ
jgi:hypothetical protein